MARLAGDAVVEPEALAAALLGDVVRVAVEAELRLRRLAQSQVPGDPQRLFVEQVL